MVFKKAELLPKSSNPTSRFLVAEIIQVWPPLIVVSTDRRHTLLYYINPQYSEHEVQLQELRPRGTDGSRVQSVYHHILAAVTLGLKFQSCNSEDWTL